VLLGLFEICTPSSSLFTPLPIHRHLSGLQLTFPFLFNFIFVKHRKLGELLIEIIESLASIIESYKPISFVNCYSKLLLSYGSQVPILSSNICFFPQLVSISFWLIWAFVGLIFTEKGEQITCSIGYKQRSFSFLFCMKKSCILHI
jgi:hypothetical protein